MIQPLYVEASASEEIIIIENKTIFEYNGFKMKINENAPPGKKIQLLSLPFSKKIQFGLEDIHELASIISENQYGDGTIYKSKLTLKNNDINYLSAKKENELIKEITVIQTADLGSGLESISKSDVLNFVDVVDIDKSGDIDDKTKQDINENDEDISSTNKSGINSGKRSSTQNDEFDIAPSSTSNSTSTNLSDTNTNSYSSASTNNMIRIPKLVSMFASRACRSSIMIGTALNKIEMKNVVKKLEGIEQPWNCPHGRPTVRHLIDLLHVHKKRKMLNINEDHCVRSRYLSYEL